jgi:hypothetical protein
LLPGYLVSRVLTILVVTKIFLIINLNSPSVETEAPLAPTLPLLTNENNCSCPFYRLALLYLCISAVIPPAIGQGSMSADGHVGTNQSQNKDQEAHLTTTEMNGRDFKWKVNLWGKGPYIWEWIQILY